MKKLFTLLALVMIAVLFKPEQAKATHATGAELTYTYIGPNQIQITLRFYRDCSGIPAPGSAFIQFSSLSCGQNFSVTLPQIAGTGNEIPIPQCVDSSATTCSGGTRYGVQEYVYTDIVTLPANCNDWVMSFDECCRNAAITTLQNGSGFDLYVSTSLDNLNTPTNNSPVFTSLPVTQFCVGNTFYYPQGASDPDGDSLVFSLVNAQTAGGASVTYSPGFSGTNPLSSSTPITIDPNTGLITFTPSQQQVAVLCVLVEEYRNGVLIGSVRRDIQLNIATQCYTISPAINAGVKANGILANCNDQTIIVPFDTALQCNSLVITDFRSLTPFGIPNPVVLASSINCSSGSTDSISLTFLNPLTYGTTYVWSKKGSDGNTLLGECGYSLAEYDTFRVIVNDLTTWVPAVDTVGCVFNSFSVDLTENIYCFSVANDGTDLTLTDANGVVLPIKNAYGYCTPTGFKANSMLVEMLNPNSSGAGPMYLTVGNGSDGNTIANDCGRFLNVGDTIAILNVQPFIPVNLGSDLTICSFDPLPVLDCGYTSLTNQWSTIPGGQISGATSPTYTTTGNGVYVVEVNNGPGCSGSDTIQVTIIPAPTDNLPADYTQCLNDPFPTLDAGNPGATYQWYFNLAPISGATSQTYTPTVGGSYSVAVDLGNVNCVGNFDVLINTTPVITVTTLSDQTVCPGVAYPVLDAGNPGLNYQWNLGGIDIPGATSQTYQPTQGGVYGVTVGTGNCAGTGSMILTISAAPVVTLSNTSVCDYDALPVLDAGNAGSTYQWNQNGTPLTGETNQTYTPTVSGTYSVDVTNAGGCTGSSSMVFTLNNSAILAVPDTNICTDGQAVLDAGISGATYLWSNGATTQTISTNVGADYTVEVTVNGCISRDTAAVVVFSYPTAPVVSCNPGGTSGFKFIYRWTAVSGATGYEVSEDGGATWIPAVNVNGEFESHGTNNTVPFLLVRATSSSICRIGTASEPTACEVTIPNIFTPNGDGKNDFLNIINIEQYPNSNVKIFNRWGKEVFSQDAYNNGDSNKRFNGKDLPDGVYFYVVDFGDGIHESKSGTVTISTGSK